MRWDLRDPDVFDAVTRRRRHHSRFRWLPHTPLGRQGPWKRGGARVIYYWFTDDHRILLLDLYTKNEAENLSHAQLKDLKRKKP